MATPTTGATLLCSGQGDMGTLVGILSALQPIWATLSSPELCQILQQQLHHGVDEVNLGCDTRAALEQFLDLAQKLAMGYHHDTLPPWPPRGHDNDTFTRAQREERTLNQRTAPSPDLAMTYALIACHTRVLDVIDAIVRFATACADMAPFLSPGYDPKFQVPEIRIGVFLAPRAAAASIFLSALVELQVDLVSKAQDVSKRFQEICRAEQTTSKQLEVSMLQYELLVDRALSCLEDTKRLKSHVLHIGLNSA
ncbi:fungal zn(2)-Cys(6) binuclear cluster domain-containing protein [Pochonia chlamydosporia 170]|uniref:Fungal zn(2)-Cys(6) binuclear cluster domain-containing protein n=1 Tax=Pochonia chlamydosporia 170 TaxID=1380566 RepID=A0A179FEU5_METCM|nr:fungal zn(2)-Cys(6) binuclear cluster domain-containing protein [Pochonia chlamydosporia 170]OAQ63579.2 fungal zn(2)-Cys(6) binuclear cluster domain-containing protein [Pochonia chlamydosporia 170]